MKINRYKLMLMPNFKSLNFIENGRKMEFKNRLEFLMHTLFGDDIIIIDKNNFEIQQKTLLGFLLQIIMKIIFFVLIVFIVISISKGFKFNALDNFLNKSQVLNMPDKDTVDNTSSLFNDINNYIPSDTPRLDNGDIDYKKTPSFLYSSTSAYYIASDNRMFYLTNPKANAYGVVYSISYNDIIIWKDTKITLPGCYSHPDIYDLVPIGTTTVKIIQTVVQLNNLTSLDSAISSLAYESSVKITKK